MRSLPKPLVVVLSILACVGAIVGWALTTAKGQAYAPVEWYEHHG